MWAQLSKERKILVSITAVAFLVATGLTWQTYQTVQVFNHANAICTGVKANISRDDLKRYAANNRTSLTFMKLDDFTQQAKLGFNQSSGDSCGCLVLIKNNRVAGVDQTFCQSM